MRHAQAHTIAVELRYEPKQVILRISDDGKGFDMDAITQRNGHWGLKNMRERANEIGAEWTVMTAPGRGTRIETILPNVSDGAKLPNGNNGQ